MFLEAFCLKLLLFTLKKGTLRFFGTADFAPGEWAGIELDEPVGKNNGSVQGKVYFICAPKHGKTLREWFLAIVALYI